MNATNSGVPDSDGLPPPSRDSSYILSLRASFCATSASVAVNTLFDTTLLTYFHGDIKINFAEDVHLVKDTTYFITLTSSGYTFGASSFVGWCNGFDLGRYTASYLGPVGVSAPMDYAAISRRRFG